MAKRILFLKVMINLNFQMLFFLIFALDFWKMCVKGVTGYWLGNAKVLVKKSEVFSQNPKGFCKNLCAFDQNLEGFGQNHKRLC